MKFLKFFAASALLLVGLDALAQSKITAVLTDASSGEPLGFATVSLLKSGQEKPIKYVLSTDKGAVAFDSVRKGTYTFRAELMGYQTYTSEVKVADKDVDLGTVKMKLDSEQLSDAVVSAVGNPIVIKKDTIEFNAGSFRTTDNDVLEDLLKKLPGVEVSEDGSISVNGQSISKITIDGKTFFLDDPQLASKNIPAKMVNKLKVIQKKSEQAEFTGIDDGQEETVIDLSVQPGMMKGLFGNVAAGGGYDLPSQDGIDGDFRYQGNAFIGRFTDKSQLSLILNGNNTNNRGASDMSGSMMRGMRGGMGGGQGGWGGGNGITTSYMAGVNGAWNLFDDKMNLGGNYLYNGSKNDVEENSIKETYLQDYNLIYNSSGLSNTNTDGHRFGVRLEHKFSDNTSILFQPSVNFGTGNYSQVSRDTTFRDDLDGRDAYKLNDAYTNNSGSNKNVSTSGFFLLRQRLGLPGRTLTAMVDYNFSNNELDGVNDNGTTSYEDGNPLSTRVQQNFNNVARTYGLSGELTYTEPLGNHFYVEAHYSASWNKSVSEKETFDMLNGGAKDYNYSNEIVNEYLNQEFGVNALYQDEKFRAQVGLAALPVKTHNSTTRYNDGKFEPQTYDSFNWNFAPQAMVFFEPTDKFSGRFFYRGTSSQPSTSQLMPVPDNSNPLNVSFGNPELKPYFSHSLRGDLRYSNRQNFTSFSLRFNGGYTQSPIVNTVWYGTNGGQYTMPFNGPASANVGVNMFGNLPIGKTNFSINNTLGVNWRRSASYVGTDVDMTLYEDEGYYSFMEDFIGKFMSDPVWYAAHITENTTQTLSANDRLRLTYRGTSLEASLGGSTRMNRSWYSISTTKDQTTTWNNQVSASLTWNWEATGISVKGDYDYNWYNGYASEQPSQSVLNAEVSKLLFNNNMTLALRAYDILGQSKNLTVTDSSNYHSEVVNNTLGRYIVCSLTWRFGTMGNNRRPGGRGLGGRGPGGPAGPPPMM